MRPVETKVDVINDHAYESAENKRPPGQHFLDAEVASRYIIGCDRHHIMFCKFRRTVKCNCWPEYNDQRKVEIRK